MKSTVCILLLLISFHTKLFSQYYLRGEIIDESGKPLSNVKMLLQSTGYVYYSGSSGSFGIMSNVANDSITLSLDGFRLTGARLDSRKYLSITMKMLRAVGNTAKPRLASVTKDLKMDEKLRWTFAGETYSTLLENNFIPASRFPETGFAMNIDKAAYSNVRRFLNMQSTVPPDAVRMEEMLNYFNFSYKEPDKGKDFDFESRLSSCPWNKENELLFLKVCARKTDPDKVPPSNLVFLIDVSGSMDMPNRLPLLQSAFKLMVDNLREKDTISIVVYGGTVGVWLPPTSGAEKAKIRQSIEELTAGGETPGESGIQQAYKLAQNKFIKNGNNRVILATDGDFNVGQKNDEELEKLISSYRNSGIYLTCLGVGMGNYKDSKLEILAKKGNGNFAYLDNEREAEKVLVKELMQTLYAIADDANLKIIFNPEMVSEYRLIGFDNKVNAVIDSSSELEGGEVGSGHTLMAMFEIKPTVINKGHITDSISSERLSTVVLDYKKPRDSTLLKLSYDCPLSYKSFDKLDSCYRFASAVVMFGSILRESKFVKAVGWNDVSILAASSYDPKDVVQREFLTLVDKAKKIYGKRKKDRQNQD
ncbi:vWA domain-containing protein [Pinibacter soli]|uniref:von Willebrand factor type A domain-containing protein n=1 Tax=Pinibacter soli TaxID=3044211 RepID=A0ABT6RI63_9BACT|nr:VWA domain-containing protein [Pinibacter soli]MDI3322263.1 von Willebrand factor type A domain-containing protein [Pinibacter soli]